MDQIINLLQEQACILGHPPKKNWWKQSGLSPSASTIQNKFGSWNKALKAAGLGTNRNTVSRQELLDDIRLVKKDIGRCPTVGEYLRLGKYSNIVNKGGWTNLIDELGWPRKRDTRKKDIVMALEQVAQDLNRVPLYTEFIHHPLGVSSGLVYKFFNSYDDLLGELEMKVPSRGGGWRTFTDGELIEDIKRIASNLGYTPTIAEFHLFSKSSGHTFATKRFGSYNNFVKAAGLKHNRGKRKIKTLDGHVVESVFEMEVDNFLFGNNIPHDVHVRVCQKRYWTCDFVVGDIWIECDGYNGNKRPGTGTKRLQEKLDYYHRYSYDLILITYNDDWRCLLSRKLSNQKINF